jgi:hypothetical protein
MHKDRDDGNKQLQQRNHETDTSFREEFRGDEQGRKEQASCSRFADREETPCLFPIQRCCPASGHPAERVGSLDDAKLVGIWVTDGGEEDRVREQASRGLIWDHFAITL